MDNNSEQDPEHFPIAEPQSQETQPYAPETPVEEAEIDDSASQVAIPPAKGMLFIAVGAVVVISFLFYMFSDDEVAEKPKERIPTEGITPIHKAGDSVVVIPPSIPDPPAPPEPLEATLLTTAPPPPPPAPIPPKLQQIAPPPPVASAPPPPAAPSVFSRGQDLDKERILKQRRSAGMFISGSATSASAEEENYAYFGSTGQDALLKKTQAETAHATVIGRNLNYIIAQGKIIEAVLETGINTDLPGMLRAIVSRDIYAESGNNVLIPKGSRLIGDYESNIKRGQGRVLIVWSRLIRPDGIDIAIDSPGTDKLGRAGIDGLIDNHYYEIFGNSILLSLIQTGIAIAAEDSTSSGGISSTTNTDGSTTTTGNTSDLAIQGAVQDIGNIATTIANDFLETQPTIIVHQGSRINVFVNRDLHFPENASNKVRFVQ